MTTTPPATTPIEWTTIRIGSLLYEEHERAGPLVRHKLFGDPTITLIEGDRRVLVDPGYGPSRERLRERSETEAQAMIVRQYLALSGLRPDDIDIVFVTHQHLDHCNLLGLFDPDRTDLVVGYQPSRDTLMPGVRVMHTPGHDPYHGALVFTSSCGNGDADGDETGAGEDWCIVVAGDAVLSLDYYRACAPYWMNHYSAGEIEQARSSMRRIAEIADVIVPGHGPPFTNSASLRASWPDADRS